MCAPAAEPRAPLRPSHAPHSSRQECWARDWKRRERAGARGRAHARLAKGPVFQHGANSASRLLTVLCWSAPKGRPISAQSAARLRCGPALPRPRPHRPRPLGALACPGPPDPNREEAGSSQLPPPDRPVTRQSLQYSHPHLFPSARVSPGPTVAEHHAGDLAVIFPARSGRLAELGNTVRPGLIAVQYIEKTIQRRGPLELGLGSSALREDVCALV